MRQRTAISVILAALVLGLAASGFVMANGPGSVEELARVSDFEAGEGELPEGLAVDRQGSLYVGMAFTREIVKVTLGPQGEVEVSSFASLPPPSPEPGEGGFMTGITTDRQGNLYVALASFNQDHPHVLGDTHGIWKVSENGEAELFASLPVTGLPNVPAFDRQGNLYVSDSALGQVWKIDSTGAAAPWVQHELLEGTGDFGLGVRIGANGIAFDKPQKNLYVANTEKGHIARVPVKPNGSAGTPKMFAGSPNLLGADGIAFDNHKNLYVAVNHLDKLVRVSPSGEGATVLKAGAPLDFPASVAFGAGRNKKSLYITNFAFGSGSPDPALLKLPVGVPGRPLP